MMLSAIFCRALLSAIFLHGLAGDRLAVRASFDSNNVRVGDPMTYTVDFIGEADFRSLHPPALAKHVDSKVWKIDDDSAKTDTYRNARRLIYRLRPLKDGVREFPSLEFAYENSRGETSVVRTVSIPVSIRAGLQAALSGLEDEVDELPLPDGIVIGDNRDFSWRKACLAAKADGFKDFDTPEARLNEAACAISEGQWARALSIYSRLEWSVGQTPAIERGIIAALAHKHNSASVELPMWRQIARPVLKYDWKGRVAVVLGGLLLISLVFFVLGRLIRVLACLAFVVFAFPAFADDPFEQMRRMVEEQRKQMMSMTSIVEEPMETPKITAHLEADRNEVVVGDTFRFIISIERPKTANVQGIRLASSMSVGMVQCGGGETLTDGKSSNPSNVVMRFAIPVRYDIPFEGPVYFGVDGTVSSRSDNTRGGGFFSFSFSRPFHAETEPVKMKVSPPPGLNRPEDYCGIVASGAKVRTRVDRKRVSTNDVVTIRYTLEYGGFVPDGVFADELERGNGFVTWREYFVADGRARVSSISLSVYNPELKKYQRVSSAPLLLEYVPYDETVGEATVVVDAPGPESVAAREIRLSPRESSSVIGTVRANFKVTEEYGNWLRVDDGFHAGWLPKQNAKTEVK